MNFVAGLVNLTATCVGREIVLVDKFRVKIQQHRASSPVIARSFVPKCSHGSPSRACVGDTTCHDTQTCMRGILHGISWIISQGSNHDHGHDPKKQNSGIKIFQISTQSVRVEYYSEPFVNENSVLPPGTVLYTSSTTVDYIVVSGKSTHLIVL